MTHRRAPVRVMHHIDPSTRADLLQYAQLDQAELIRGQQRDSELYRRWRRRKLRRRCLGIGVLVLLSAATLFAALVLLGWSA